MKKYILLLAFLCIHISLSYAEVLTENDTIINNVRYKLIKNEGYAPYYVVEGLKDCKQITSPLIINSITFTRIALSFKMYTLAIKILLFLTLHLNILTFHLHFMQ